jgi:hypothetical protein
LGVLYEDSVHAALSSGRYFYERNSRNGDRHVGRADRLRICFDSESQHGQAVQLKTAEDGEYRALLLRPDSYDVQIAVSGFELASKSIELTVGQTAVLDFELHVAADAVPPST